MEDYVVPNIDVCREAFDPGEFLAEYGLELLQPIKMNMSLAFKGQENQNSISSMFILCEYCFIHSYSSFYKSRLIFRVEWQFTRVFEPPNKLQKINVCLIRFSFIV